MQEARARLEGLSEPSPELFRVLAELGSLACQNKDLNESISLYEEALKLRERLFGERSLEYSEGMIHLAQINATGCETDKSNFQRARMYAELAVDNFIGCGDACRPAYLHIVMQHRKCRPSSCGNGPTLQRFRPSFVASMSHCRNCRRSSEARYSESMR